MNLLENNVFGIVVELHAILWFLFQFYLLKPDHVPKPEKEDISISGNTPDENKELLEERVGSTESGDDKKDK